MKPTNVLAWAAALVCGSASGAADDWAVYGGEARGTRYSTLMQIDRDNVSKLTTTWTLQFDEPGASQTHPLAIDGVVYAYTPSLKVIAIDGATGKQRWQFDSGIPGSGPQRGLAWWRKGKERRLLASVMHYLYALDPATCCSSARHLMTRRFVRFTPRPVRCCGSTRCHSLVRPRRSRTWRAAGSTS